MRETHKRMCVQYFKHQHQHQEEVPIVSDYEVPVSCSVPAPCPIQIKSLHLSYCKSFSFSQLLTVTYTNPRKNSFRQYCPVSPAFWVQTKKIALTSYRKNRYYLHLPPLLQTMVIDRWKSLSHLMTIQHLQTSHHWERMSYLFSWKYSDST